MANLNLSVETAREILEFSLAEYSSLRADYWEVLYDIVFRFLEGKGNVSSLRIPFRQTIFEAYDETANLAWIDGGGSLPLSDDAKEWVAARIAEELGFSDGMASRLNLLRREGEGLESTTEAFRRAEGYSQSLDRVYANVKILAAGNRMLTFAGDDGAESCSDCQRYKGQRHRAKWWFSHGAIPPNRDFECHGYNCQHVMIDDNGKLFTI